MKYLKHFEFYQQTIVGDESFNKKSLEYLSKLSDVEKINLKKELEKFASDYGLTYDDLKNTELVTKVLMHESLHDEKHIARWRNEGVVSWLKNNWGGLMRLISKYGSILSIVSFALGLGTFYLTGVDTMPIVKASAAAYIISNAAGALSGLG
jgi:hypothetical protein